MGFINAMTSSHFEHLFSFSKMNSILLEIFFLLFFLVREDIAEVLFFSELLSATVVAFCQMQNTKSFRTNFYDLCLDFEAQLK